MRRMSSDLTSPQPVGHPTPGVEATLIPPANLPAVEPERPEAGLAPTSRAGGDGSLDAATPDTAQRPSDVPGMANQFAAVARELASEQSVAAALQRLVDIATVIVPGCHHAGVTVMRRGRP